MLAVRRTDVDELNLRARTHMRTAGLLTGPSMTVPVGPYTTARSPPATWSSPAATTIGGRLLELSSSSR